MINDLDDTSLHALINDPTSAPGPRNAAPYLLKLPTVPLRARAMSRARLAMNLVGGNWSGAVWSAVQETKRIGLAESADERYNREMLEREHMAKCLALKRNCPSIAHI